MSERHLGHQAHVHACGHSCACALPEHESCVACELRGTEQLERPAVWARRWPPHHLHPVDDELPAGWR